MDLMHYWRRNLEDTNQVTFVPNYTSYDFVPKVQTISLKNLVLLTYGLLYSHFLRVPWIIGNCCESEMHLMSCFLSGSLRTPFSLFTFLSTAFFIVFLSWYSPFLLFFVLFWGQVPVLIGYTATFISLYFQIGSCCSFSHAVTCGKKSLWISADLFYPITKIFLLTFLFVPLL